MPMNGSDHPGEQVSISAGQIADLKEFLQPIRDLAVVLLPEFQRQRELADERADGKPIVPGGPFADDHKDNGHGDGNSTDGANS